LSFPTGAAVDQASGDVYVAEAGNFAIEKFDRSGDFIASWGWGVSDGQARYEVCTSNCLAGLAGSGDHQFSLPFGIAVDPANGDVYVSDVVNRAVDKFDSSGNPIAGAEFSLTSPSNFGPFGSLAVDPASHHLYVPDNRNHVEDGVVDEFTSAGAFVGTRPSTSSPFMVAAASNGNLYSSSLSSGLEEYDASGNLIKTWDPGRVLAVTVDHSNNHVFVDHGGDAVEYDASGNQVASTVAGSYSGSSFGIAVNETTKDVYFVDAGDPRVYVLGPVTTPDASTRPATGVTPTDATLSGTINPNGVKTTYRFDYGTDTNYGSHAPSPNGDVGSDSSAHDVTQTLSGLAPGTTYHYRLVADSNGNLVYGSDQTFTTQELTTVVTTGAATEVTTTGARVSGTINPMGAHIHYHFDYGTDTSYGGQAPSSDGEAGSDSSVHELSQQLTGLTPDTTYHYRLVATANGASVYGPDRTFTTQPLTTVVTTGAATNITIVGATVGGTINPMGTDTRYHFDYGTDTSYGSRTPSPDAGVGSDSTAHTLNRTLTDLTPRTTYHYRLVATVNGASVYGADKTFTTAQLLTVAETGAATKVGQQTVTLSGTINPKGNDTQYHFEWGPNTHYGRQAPLHDKYVGAGNRELAVTEGASGLTPGTTYHYRVVAYVSGLVVVGHDRTFTTKNVPGVPIVVRSGVASTVSPSKVTLTGSINPRGLDTQYYFEWGADTTYANNHVRAVLADVPSGTVARAVSQTLTGPFLTSNVTYHYRLVGVVSGTRVYGVDRTFTTPTTALSAKTINVMDPPYSAAGDGKTNDRNAIQDALDAAGAAGGKTVLLPAGHTFLSGSVIIPSDATLDIEGTLLQSTDLADYAPGTAYVDPPPSGIEDSACNFMNPMVLALNAHDVTLTGHGAIQMQVSSGIPLTQIGFSHVTRFSIRNVQVLGGSATFGVGVFNGADGIVAGTVQGGDTDFYQDAFAIVNSSRIRVTNNYIASTGEGAYVAEDYKDPRHGDPWIKALTGPTLPSRDQEWDRNYVTSTMPGAAPVLFGNVPWGNLWATAPDQRQVEISDIYVHDNEFVAPEDGALVVGDQGFGGDTEGPTTRMRYVNNTYLGPTFGPEPPTWAMNTPSQTSTDSEYDWPGAMNSAALRNPDFQWTGDAWWTTVGNAGATTEATPPAVPEDGSGTQWVGYALAKPHGPSELFQGLGMRVGTHVLRVDVRVHGRATLFARDTCTGTTLAEKTLTTRDWGQAELAIREHAVCQNVQIGVRVERTGTIANWAMIDNATLDDQASAPAAVTSATRARGARARFQRTARNSVIRARTLSAVGGRRRDKAAVGR
jgi:phosphodiesterase/alkaline phosphatase D-like protein